jgi:hypothetical protein
MERYKSKKVPDTGSGARVRATQTHTRKGLDNSFHSITYPAGLPCGFTPLVYPAPGSVILPHKIMSE